MAHKKRKEAAAVTPPKRWPAAANYARTTALKNLNEIERLSDTGDGYVECGNRAAIKLVLAQIGRLAAVARAELLLARAEDE